MIVGFARVGFGQIVSRLILLDLLRRTFYLGDWFVLNWSQLCLFFISLLDFVVQSETSAKDKQSEPEQCSLEHRVV